MARTLEQVYDRMAPVYYWVFGLSLEGARRRALRLANIERNENVLEVGVGTGLTFKYLPEGVNFTGIDLSDRMLERALERAQGLGKASFTLRKMNASQLELPDESFDVIISAHFLSATSDPVASLIEMKRVLKKTGRILLVNNFQRSDAMSIFEPLAKKLGFSLRLNIHELSLKTGLRIDKKTRVSHLMPIDAIILKP